MKTIMVVDDDAFITSVYRNRFMKEGYRVEIAADGITALEQIQKVQPDLVILDLQMPGLNGVDVLRKLRKTPSSARLPVLVFSNAYLRSYVEQAWSAGASDVLCKTNCTPNHLIDRVNEMIETSAKIAKTEPAVVPRMVTPPPLPVADPEQDKIAMTGLRRQFLEKAATLIQTLRTQLSVFIESAESITLEKKLAVLGVTIHQLTGSAGVARFSRIAQMASALEGLIAELREHPHGINISTVRTLMRAVETLAVLADPAATPMADACLSPLVLVVDDDTMSRRAVYAALEKASIKSISVDDPILALKLMELNIFDLVFLDVDMPGMNGFTLRMKMLAIPSAKTTPVVFISALKQFSELSKSRLFKNDEIIAKPFPLVELAVKALTYLLRT